MQGDFFFFLEYHDDVLFLSEHQAAHLVEKRVAESLLVGNDFVGSIVDDHFSK